MNTLPHSDIIVPDHIAVSFHDDRWKNIERNETECTQYLQESESFLFNLLKDADFQSVSRDSAEAGPRATDRIPSVYILPRQPVRFFGRSHELQSLGDSLKIHHSVTIRGIAGVGKTSIALRFAHQSLSEYSTIIWMRSDPSTALDQCCIEALRRFGMISEAEKPGIESRQKWRDFLAQAG